MRNSTLEIELENSDNKFKPGEEIKGRISWFVDPSVQDIELRLFWFTKGKGTQDVEIVSTSGFDAGGGTGNAPFSIVAPVEPYSFSGKLISLIWALELIDKSGNHFVRREIVIAPEGKEIELGTANEAARKSFFQRSH